MKEYVKIYDNGILVGLREDVSGISIGISLSNADYREFLEWEAIEGNVASEENI